MQRPVSTSSRRKRSPCLLNEKHGQRAQEQGKAVAAGGALSSAALPALPAPAQLHRPSHRASSPAHEAEAAGFTANEPWSLLS